MVNKTLKNAFNKFEFLQVLALLLLALLWVWFGLLSFFPKIQIATSCHILFLHSFLLVNFYRRPLYFSEYIILIPGSTFFNESVK